MSVRNLDRRKSHLGGNLSGFSSGRRSRQRAAKLRRKCEMARRLQLIEVDCSKNSMLQPGKMKTISHDKLLVRLSERALRFRRCGHTESERGEFLDKETWDDTDSVHMKGLVDPI